MPKTAGALPGQDERQTTSAPRRETHNLTVRYGKIGIPAVAAALRYCGTGKNPADAPVVIHVDHRRVEIAA